MKSTENLTLPLSLLKRKFDQFGSVCMKLKTKSSDRHNRKMFSQTC